MPKKREITPHKGGRNERMEIRVGDREKSLIGTCAEQLNANLSDSDRKLSKADVLIYAFNLLWGLPNIEIHARVHGIRGMAYKSLGDGGITVVSFGDGELIMHNSVTGKAQNFGRSKWTESEIIEFLDSVYFDNQLPYISERLELLNEIRNRG